MQIKETDIQQCLPIETAFWLMADEEMQKWGKNEKRLGRVGEKKMAAVFLTVYGRVGRAGRLLVSLFPVNVYLGVYLGYSMEVQRGLIWPRVSLGMSS